MGERESIHQQPFLCIVQWSYEEQAQRTTYQQEGCLAGFMVIAVSFFTDSKICLHKLSFTPPQIKGSKRRVVVSLVPSSLSLSLQLKFPTPIKFHNKDHESDANGNLVNLFSNLFNTHIHVYIIHSCE